MDDSSLLTRDRAAESRQGSWARAARHAAAVVMLLIVTTCGAAMAGLGKSPRAMGEAIGSVVLWVFLGTMVVSYFVQSRSWAALKGLALLGGLLGALAIVAAFRHPRKPHSSLTPGDGAHLEITTEMTYQVLHHPHLGYSLRVPLGLEPLPEATVAKFNKSPGVSIQAYSNPAKKQFLAILEFAVDSEDDFRTGFHAAVASNDAGMAKSTGGQKVHVILDDVSWDAAHREAHHHATIGSLNLYDDAFVHDYDGRTIAVVLLAASRGDDSMASVAPTFTAP